MNTMKWLLKREFWEHRGGFFWAPLVVSGLMVLFTILGIITTEVFKDRFFGEVNIGVSLQHLTEKLTPDELAQVGPAIEMGLISMGGLVHIVLAFVLFFYLIGALFDERRDRSVLFWKSLPISDASTVASKAITAALVAPVIALVFILAMQLSLLVIASIYVMAYGVSPWTVIWGPISLLDMFALQVVSMVVSAIWMLPAIGWLMLVSVWARSKPLLWAVAVPIGIGLLINWFDVLQNFSIPDYRYWQHVVLQLLGGVLPNSWQFLVIEDTVKAVEVGGNMRVLGTIGDEFGWGALRRALALPNMWIGAVAGIAMLFGAIRLRRWRDDG